MHSQNEKWIDPRKNAPRDAVVLFILDAPSLGEEETAMVKKILRSENAKLKRKLDQSYFHGHRWNSSFGSDRITEFPGTVKTATRTLPAGESDAGTIIRTFVLAKNNRLDCSLFLIMFITGKKPGKRSEWLNTLKKNKQYTVLRFGTEDTVRKAVSSLNNQAFRYARPRPVRIMYKE